MNRFSLILGPIVLFLFACSADAQYGGGGAGWRFGGSLGVINSGQSDMNTLIERANTRVGGITTSQLGNAWELSTYLGYRFDLIEMQLHPSYFLQSATGSGGGQDYNYELDGFTVFPLFRFYMLENDAIAFFSNLGVGMGFINGTIKEGPDEVDFSGYDTGYIAGLGAHFCFFGSNHCMTVEGNFRFLSVERLIGDTANGDFSDNGTPASLSQAAAGKEVELDEEDLGVSMSGILGKIGYMYRF